MKEWRDYGINIGLAKGSGTDKRMTCPECSPYRKKKNYPCLSVNIEEGIWNCFHCGWAGTLKSGADKPSMPYQQDKQYRKPTYRMTPLPTKVLDWFKKRGISENVLARNRISYGPVYFPQLEGEQPSIQFPYYRDGEVVNVKYRGREKAFRMVGGAERILYGFDDIAEDVVFICEGEMDKLSIEMAGISSCVSVPDGAPTPNTKNYSTKFDFLLSAETKLTTVGKVVIAVDSDAPGQRLAEELVRRLGPERCFIVPWPDGCKDANDVLVSQGACALRDYLEAAKPWPVKGIIEVNQLYNAVDLLYSEGLKPGANPGWISVSRHYRVRPGEFTVVTGIPSHGKSQFVAAMMMNLAKSEDWRFLVYSPEHFPLERYVALLLEIYAGEPFSNAQSKMNPMTLANGYAWLHDHISFLMPEDEEPTIEHLLALARVQVYRQGIQGLILDPWNEIEHTRPANMTETEYISQTLSRIRRFARQHGVHVWIIAHPTKLSKAQKGRYEGQYPPPTPYDISGSSNWRNKADNCLSIWRDVEANGSAVEVHIQKIRYRENGTPGMAELKFDRSCGRYIEQTVDAAHHYL